MHIALTGNIGSGKSTVCSMLKALLPEYAFYSVDDAVRALYLTPAYQAMLKSQFGTTDRKTLSDRVFANRSMKVALEEQTLQFLLPTLYGWLRQPNIVVEFPLLFETALCVPWFDHVIALVCPASVQAARVCARDGIPPEKLAQIRASQLDGELKALLADSVVSTDGTLEDVQLRVQKAVSTLRAGQPLATPACVSSQNQAFQDLQTRCEQFFGTPLMWPVLEKAYSEPHRAYHNLQHLRELFDALSPVLAQRPWSRAIELAVWFHDVVYVTGNEAYADNERLSARTLWQWVRRDAPGVFEWRRGLTGEITVAASMIMATRQHRAGSDWIRQDRLVLEDTQLFLDADLAILAAGEQRVQAYDEAIAQEWGETLATPSRAFAKGRRDALRALACRPRLFETEAFQGLEARARVNLDSLVRKWGSFLDA